MKRAVILLALLLLLSGCGETAAEPSALPAETAVSAESAVSETKGGAAQKTGSMELEYAEAFSVDYYDDGSALVTIGEDRFRLLPAGADNPEDSDGIPVIHCPVSALYVASSSAMDHFVSLDVMDQVAFTSTTYENWGLPEVRAAMEEETLRYAGKYSAPDFELLLLENCPLAIENTMIYHSPDIKEKLEALGIPVIVEQSSYEPHPLGRVEWIKLYGLLLDREAEAEAFFRKQAEQLRSLETRPGEQRSAAFFHISTAGAAVVRKPGDYVSKMIELAGGRYVFSELPGSDENALSTMNMQMEAFYSGARDADVLIYNSTIDGELETLDQLLEKSSLLADFRAVQTGNVWCTEHNMFQKSTGAAGIIADLNTVLCGDENIPDELTYLHRLK